MKRRQRRESEDPARPPEQHEDAGDKKGIVAIYRDSRGVDINAIDINAMNLETQQRDPAAASSALYPLRRNTERDKHNPQTRLLKQFATNPEGVVTCKSIPIVFAYMERNKQTSTSASDHRCPVRNSWGK